LRFSQKLGAVTKVIQQPQSARRSLSSLLTPKRLLETPATADATQQSMGAGLFADIASMPWAWTLHSLFRIINELPTKAEVINKFIYHEIEKDPNRDLTDLTMETTAESLNHFFKFERSLRTIRNRLL
jgi:hypothetical protein